MIYNGLNEREEIKKLDDRIKNEKKTYEFYKKYTISTDSKRRVDANEMCNVIKANIESLIKKRDRIANAITRGIFD
jgi:hydroxylamine reductase (hybrid-cluster protein)